MLQGLKMLFQSKATPCGPCHKVEKSQISGTHTLILSGLMRYPALLPAHRWKRVFSG